MNPLVPLWIIAGGILLLVIGLPIMDWLAECHYHADVKPDRTRCTWCSIELARWRVLLRRRACSVCAPKLYGDAGIYGQTGGPPCSKGARAGQTERRRP